MGGDGVSGADHERMKDIGKIRQSGSCHRRLLWLHPLLTDKMDVAFGKGEFRF